MPEPQTRLETARLLLRPPREADADALPAVLSDREIAANTLTIPFPYTPEDGRKACKRFAGAWADGSNLVFLLERKDDGALVGTAGLEPVADHDRAELGYVIGRRWWGAGYATEAASRLLRWAFEDLRLRRVHAHAMAHNPASMRVMEKIGMTREGVLRRHIRKGGRYIDAVVYGVLRSEWDANQA